MNLSANPLPRRSVGGRRPPAGFTLVEMVITLLILGILVAAGLPTFSDATLGSRLGSTANNLVVSFYLARSEAIKRNTIVRVCPSTDGNTCASAASWETGWIVMAPYASGTSDDVIIQRQSTVSGNIRVLHKNAALTSVLTSAVDMPPSGIRSGAVTRPSWCAAERPTWASRSASSVCLPPAGRR